MADTTVDATRRLNVKKQTLDDAYAAPANFLEIDVINPITHGVGKKRYTDYEVRMRVRLSFQNYTAIVNKFNHHFFISAKNHNLWHLVFGTQSLSSLFNH